MTQLTLEQINNLDIVDFLAGIGIHPKKISGHQYWYLSPLPDRSEKTPSFKVNRKLNRWWDFGAGEGSTLVDFGIRYYNCTIRELKEKLSAPTLSQRDVPHHYPTPDTEAEQKIQVLQTAPIHSFYLIQYLWERRIPLDVAQKYCVEVQYTFGPRPYYALGFPSDAGGYELRNKFHKYSIPPKSHTLITPTKQDTPANDQPIEAREIAVFEGFFDMLTFITFINIPMDQLPDLLVLNSVTLFKNVLPLMEPYPRKHLFLDNDKTGDKYTEIGLAMKAGYIDHRSLYKGYNDLNEWVCNFGKASIPSLHDLPPAAP